MAEPVVLAMSFYIGIASEVNNLINNYDSSISFWNYSDNVVFLFFYILVQPIYYKIIAM